MTSIIARNTLTALLGRRGSLMAITNISAADDDAWVVCDATQQLRISGVEYCPPSLVRKVAWRSLEE